LKSSKALLYIKILLAVIFWGTSFVATKTVLYEIKPVTVIILRLILASILLSAIAFYTRRTFSFNLRNHGWIFILALIAVFHLWIQVTGLQYTTAANTGWIIGTAPVFMAVLGLIIYKERIGLLQFAGIIIAIFGLLLLIGKGNVLNIGLIENKGDLLVLGSAFTWGVYSMVNKKISLSYSPLMTILYLFLMMAIIIIPFNLNSETIRSVIKLSLIGWVSIFFLGLFCSGVAYVIWAQALRDMESAKVGAFLYFEPLVTVIAAWFFLNEVITIMMIVSGLLITVGVVFVNRE
jgi:drug/metabolite transporter (DMT)-like permease